MSVSLNGIDEYWNMEEEQLTGPLGSKVLGSAAWSDWSLMARESRVARNDLAKDNSVMVSILERPFRRVNIASWRMYFR